MKMQRKAINTILLSGTLMALILCCGKPGQTHISEGSESLVLDSFRLENERHLKNIRKLTDGGDNAEAYWSFDQSKLIMQVSNEDWGIACDQIFLYDFHEDIQPGEKMPMLSTGRGRTTCSYFLPGDSLILYASTHLSHEQCPETPHRGPGGEYVWPIYEEYDIFVSDLDGRIVQQLTDVAGYDAEATVSPKGDLIVFTSMRNGDLDLYTMKLDGSDVKQVTDQPGYDGGAFFSPDGQWLIFRSSRPKTEEELSAYRELLERGLVQPTEMEIYVCRIDGSDLRQVTDLGRANWAPYFHPSGEKIIFSSNHQSERGFPFNLFMIDIDGSNLKQITFDETFDSFPMFSPDGKKLVFSSNRMNGGTRSTNVFTADWVD